MHLHDKAPDARDQPLDNFFEFWIGHLDASALDNLFIVHGTDGYAELAHHIHRGLAVRGLRGTLLSLEEEPERVRDVGIKHRQDPRAVVCLVYLLDYARIGRDSTYRARVKNLGVFDFWDTPRVRIIADVPLALFGRAFAQSKTDLIQRANDILMRLAGSDSFEVSTPSGAKLIVTVARHPSPWYAIVGNSSDHVLPAGELAARPVSVDGRIDFSGTILGTIPFGFKYGLIKPGELTLDFEGGNLTNMTGTRTPLIRDLESVIKRFPEIAHVGEAAFSFNSGITELVGTGYHWEERYPGFHFGLGAEISENLNSIEERNCAHHVDFVLSAPTIRVGGKIVFTNQQFCLLPLD